MDSKKRRDDFEQLLGSDILEEQLSQAGAFAISSDIKVIAIKALADQSEFRYRRPGTGVGTPRDPQDHRLVTEAGVFELPDQAGQPSFRLGYRKPAGRQRRAGHACRAKRRRQVFA